ncbi:MAG: hypothetical protein ABI460_11170 [Caldimonas sp.]
MWATLLAVTALPAEAIVVSQRAVAETLVLVFLGFAAFLFLVVLGLAAMFGGRGQRAARLRVALIAFPAASAAAAAVLWALSSSAFEHALLLAALFLAATALALVVQAFVASRRP